jgi:cell volume regulation protein A
MESIHVIDTVLLLGALLIFAGILSSLLASRFGAPLLLVFLLVGMLAGEDGPGGIAFSDYRFAYLVGSLSLAVILFDGGLRTKVASFRVGLRPALLLATVGVVVTAGITGAVAVLALGLTPLEGMLLGSIVASTDAAAVFSLLRTGGLQLKERVGEPVVHAAHATVNGAVTSSRSVPAAARIRPDSGSSRRTSSSRRRPTS